MPIPSWLEAHMMTFLPAVLPADFALFCPNPVHICSVPLTAAPLLVPTYCILCCGPQLIVAHLLLFKHLSQRFGPTLPDVEMLFGTADVPAVKLKVRFIFLL